jgi:hypothetical protein
MLSGMKDYTVSLENLLCASQNMRTKGSKVLSSVVKVNDKFKISVTLNSEICNKLAQRTNYSLYLVPTLQCTATKVREELRSAFRICIEVI